MRQLSLVVTLVLTAAASAFAQRSSPRYRIGRVLQNNVFGTTLHISIGVQDFAPQRLICLAQELRRRYQDRARIDVLIFTNHAASRKWIVPASEGIPEQSRWNSYFHGAYYYDAAAHEEYIRIDPDPLQATSDSRLSTRINLAATGAPHCRVQAGGRCLLVLPYIWPYQGEYSDQKASGSVTLSGKVAGNGKVGKVRAIESRLTSDEEGDFFKSTAIQNLKAWRFESASHTDVIQVTYDYRISFWHSSLHMPVRMQEPGKSAIEMNLSILKP